MIRNPMTTFMRRSRICQNFPSTRERALLPSRGHAFHTAAAASSPLSCRKGGLCADGGPGHFVDPDEAHVSEPLLMHHAFDGRSLPVMRNPRQHLVEHDRPQVPKAELPQ